MKDSKTKKRNIFVVFDFMDWQLNETTKREAKGNIFGLFDYGIRNAKKEKSFWVFYY